MYRIKFVTNGAYWAIQLYVWGLLWVCVKEYVSTGDGPAQRLQVKEFETYDDAMAYAEQRGISKAYRRKEASCPYPVEVTAQPVYYQQVQTPPQRP